MAVAIETQFESWSRLVEGESDRMGFSLVRSRLVASGVASVGFVATCRRCDYEIEEQFDRAAMTVTHAIVESFKEYLLKIREHRSGHDAADGSISRDQLRYEIERAFKGTGRSEHDAAALVRAFERMTNPQAITEAWGLLSNAERCLNDNSTTAPGEELMNRGEWRKARDRWVESYAPKKAAAT